MPRRLLVDLPNVANRAKILRVITQEEELGPDVDLEELSTLLHGYSGSDLRNLCIAAAYNPIRELLKAEKSGKVPKGRPRRPSRPRLPLPPLATLLRSSATRQRPPLPPPRVPTRWWLRRTLRRPRLLPPWRPPTATPTVKTAATRRTR
eukprot:TRINITY_DN2492_c0_g1_i13.p3 TRINITY_DN2492_c0_g1~~TRINITY_DN2492_c0_g1_i13.p3  ORF type:complete len:149 (+),score=46.36 TRINITY_DN2492_c0_g1_i13:342-788(+)